MGFGARGGGDREGGEEQEEEEEEEEEDSEKEKEKDVEEEKIKMKRKFIYTAPTAFTLRGHHCTVGQIQILFRHRIIYFPMSARVSE